MSRPQYPSDLASRFLVRMPGELKERIAQDARDNRRSMNSEIVHRLLQLFGESETPTTGNCCQASPAVGPNETACQGGPEIHG